MFETTSHGMSWQRGRCSGLTTFVNILHGWWFQPTPLKNHGVNVRLDHHPNENGENQSHVPKHQPEILSIQQWFCCSDFWAKRKKPRVMILSLWAISQPDQVAIHTEHCAAQHKRALKCQVMGDNMILSSSKTTQWTWTMMNIINAMHKNSYFLDMKSWNLIIYRSSMWCVACFTDFRSWITMDGPLKSHWRIPRWRCWRTAISGTDWLEVPIPYMFGLFFRPM